MRGEHLRAILWLRWRLSRNQLARGGKVNAALTVLFALLAVAMVVGGAVGGFLLGAFALRKLSPDGLLLAWDALALVFLLLWGVGVLVEIQRSETIDLGRLLHLPVSLPEVFAFNYVASHLSLALLVCVPVMLGTAAGLAVTRGPLMLLLPLLLAGFLFMVTAWTYCLRGWLVTLMVNKRTRRTLVTGIGAALVLLGQLPNLYFQVLRPEGSRRSATAHAPVLTPGLLLAHHVLPPLWPGDGVRGLAAGDPLPCLLATVGSLALGALGLRRAYRGTVRFYQGAPTAGARRWQRRAIPRPPAARGGRALLERQLPWVPEEAAALALASLRSLLRAPEVRMMLILPVVMTAVLAAVLGRRGWGAHAELRPFLASGVVSFALLGMIRLFGNQFGFDREAFRALALLPTPRRLVLLGKNLAALPLAGSVALAYLLVLLLAAHVGPLAFLAGLVQFLAGFLLVSVLGNLFSILAPYRIAAGSLKPTKTTPRATLLIFVSHLLMPTLMLPVFMPAGAAALGRVAGVSPAVPVDLLLSLVLLALVAPFYYVTLSGLGELLERREGDILRSVTEERE